MTKRHPSSAPWRFFLAIALGVALHLSGCHQGGPPDGAKSGDAKAGPAAADDDADAKPGESKAKGTEPQDGVTLTTEQADKLGVATEAARAVEYTAETSGYGMVVPHEAIATAVAELSTAQLTQKQTQAALVRAQKLEGTPGALSGETEDAAKRQSAADAAALVLATQRLSTIIGQTPGWKSAETPAILQALASGKFKLLRATFPLGTLQGRIPQALRVAHLDALQSPAPQAALGVKLTSVWDAPADNSIPGRSFFALLKGGDFAEGERLLVWAPGAGPARAGVLVPAAALVISNGKYWCYLETQPGHYRRVDVSTERPFNDGYVVTEGIAVGSRVVTSAAALLLAHELNSDADAD